MTLKEKATQTFNMFSEEQLAAFVTLFGSINGKIIEHYPNDYPYPSCLELGLSVAGKPLHVCCAIGNGKLCVITAYYPTLDMWENDMKTGKAVE